MSNDAASALLDAKKCALVVIDVQEKLMPVIHEAGQVLAVVQDLVRFAGILGMPVVVTEQEKLGPTLAPLAGLVPDFSPVTKTAFSCFGCEAFVRALENLDVDTLVLAGVEAHICVTQTALAARGRYRVHVAADAVSSRTPFNRDIALNRLRAGNVTVTSKEMFFFEALGRAGTPDFKKVLPLVK